MTINLPVSIGDHVYFIRDHENQKRIAFGTIKEIFFSQDMRLMIRVKGYRAAEWGAKAFRTRKEAETAIGNTVWESASDAQKNATAVYNAMVEYVRNALTESRESQKKLADRAGVSQGTVTSFLSGGRSVGTNLTLALLEASGIDTTATANSQSATKRGATTTTTKTIESANAMTADKTSTPSSSSPRKTNLSSRHGAKPGGEANDRLQRRIRPSPQKPR
nr:MAG TPA: Regulatory protein-modification, helix-turn-helix, transcriptional regulato, DNA [Caudoviricetes sp.]